MPQDHIHIPPRLRLRLIIRVGIGLRVRVRLRLGLGLYLAVGPNPSHKPKPNPNPNHKPKPNPNPNANAYPNHSRTSQECRAVPIQRPGGDLDIWAYDPCAGVPCVAARLQRPGELDLFLHSRAFRELSCASESQFRVRFTLRTRVRNSARVKVRA